MKRICILLAFAGIAMNAQVGIGTETPNATLDIKATNEAAPASNDGLLIPKVEEFPAVDPGAPQDGMLVYATGTGSVSKGFYYWDHGTTSWVLATGAKNIDDLSDGSTDGTGSSVFFGIDSGSNDDGTNNQNTAAGYQSLLSNTSGPANTAMGYWSLRDNSSGNGNTAFGHYAGRANTSGQANTMLGAAALYSKTAGNNNLAMGGLAGGSLTSGDGNIFIGHRAGFNETITSNKLYIENSDASSPLLYGEFDTNILRTNGTLQIGNPASGGYALPATDGTLAQLLQTDGNGTIGWVEYDDVGIRRIDELLDGRSDVVGYSVFLGNRAGQNTTNLTNSASVGVGYETLEANTSGAYNVAVGFWSMYRNTTGSYNVAVGRRSLLSNTEGIRNTAIGTNAINANTTGEENTAIGAFALANNTVGDSNMAGGAYALFNNTIGAENLALGYHSMYENIDGSQNVAVGNRALEQNVDGNQNVGVGLRSLENNVDGNYNVGVGAWALNNNTDGIYNVATGTRALFSNGSGNNNVANGAYALQDNTSGDGNVAVGANALAGNTTANYNTATGTQALEVTQTGGANVANGYQAMRLNSGGTLNVGIGFNALFNNANGNRNTALGSSAGFRNTGDDNLFLGASAGYWIVSGNNNVTIGTRAGAGSTAHSKFGGVFIGYEAGELEENSNRLYIDNSNTTTPLLYGEFDNNLLGINGDLAVGHQVPGAPLHVESAGTSGSQTIVAALEATTSNRPVLLFSETGATNFNSGMSIEYNGAGSGSANKIAINGVGGTPLYEFENGGDAHILAGDLTISNSGSDRVLRMSDSGGNADRVLMRQDGSNDIYVGDVDNNNGDTYIRAGGSSEIAVIAGSGFVGVNDITPSWTFEVNGNAAKPGGGSWINSSDRRLKSNIQPFAQGLDQILQIDAVTYQYNSLSGFDTEQQHVGVVAQELQKVAPYMVRQYENEHGQFLAVDNSAMTYLLINAVKEQQQMIEQLQLQIESLTNQINNSHDE
ncbi:MAG: tail fiber domain-containing protein [Bacteroidota bacterium]